jgi:hypothetical protein
VAEKNSFRLTGTYRSLTCTASQQEKTYEASGQEHAAYAMTFIGKFRQSLLAMSQHQIYQIGLGLGMGADSHILATGLAGKRPGHFGLRTNPTDDPLLFWFWSGVS